MTTPSPERLLKLADAYRTELGPLVCKAASRDKIPELLEDVEITALALERWADELKLAAVMAQQIQTPPDIAQEISRRTMELL